MKYQFLSVMSAALLVTACNNPAPTSQNPSASASAPAAVSEVAKPQGSLIERINNKGTIIVATEGTYPPFTYLDEKGQLTGYDVEVVRAVAKKLGVNVEFKTLKWVGILPGVQSGEYDIAANQIVLSSPERQAQFDKSEPYSWSGVGVLVHADDNRVKKLEDIRGLNAAQTQTSSYGERAHKLGANVRPVESLTQAANLVKRKEADVTINDELAVLDYVKHRGEDKVKVAWSSPAEEKKAAGLIVVKGNDEAMAKINEAMIALKKDGTLKQLSEEYFGKDVTEK